MCYRKSMTQGNIQGFRHNATMCATFTNTDNATILLGWDGKDCLINHVVVFVSYESYPSTRGFDLTSCSFKVIKVTTDLSTYFLRVVGNMYSQNFNT